MLFQKTLKTAMYITDCDDTGCTLYTVHCLLFCCLVAISV